MKFKRASIILLSLISSLSLITSCSEKNSTSLYEGTDPSTLFDGYYAELDTWNNYKDLRQKLYNIVRRDYSPISYNSDPLASGQTNWSTNRNADQSLTNFDKVHVLYSDNEEYKQTGNTSSWQREHCFPASLATGVTTGEATKTIGTATDFHNLYASYSSGNSAHSNMSYGYVNKEYDYSYVGNAIYQKDVATPNGILNVFEPNDVDKGKVSRAIFYMALMYGNDSWVEDTDKNGNKLSVGLRIVRKGVETCTLMSAQMGKKCHENLEDLLEWNDKFAPDRLEYQHTTYVQSVQGNRNPFIDFPELVDYCFGEKQLEKGSLKNLHNIYDILDLGNDKTHNLAISDVKYSYDGGETYSSQNDLKIYEVSNSFKKMECTDYTVEGVKDNEIVHENQNGTVITIKKGELSTSYQISVASDEWQNLNYINKFTATNLKNLKQDNDIIVSNNGVDMKVSVAASKSVDVLDHNTQVIGAAIGSNASPAGTIVIESQNTIKVNNNYVIKKIYIEANSTSKYVQSFTLEMYINGRLVKQNNYSYNSSSSLVSYGINLKSFDQESGKIKIVISNIDGRFNLGRIGLLVE